MRVRVDQTRGVCTVLTEVEDRDGGGVDQVEPSLARHPHPPAVLVRQAYLDLVRHADVVPAPEVALGVESHVPGWLVELELLVLLRQDVVIVRFERLEA